MAQKKISVQKSENYNNEKMDFENKGDEKEPTIKNQSLKSLKEGVSTDALKGQIKSNSVLQQIVEQPNENGMGTVSKIQHTDSNYSKDEKGERKSSTKKGTNTSLGIKVSPDIFVSLKKGSIDQYYTIGKTLGEG